MKRPLRHWRQNRRPRLDPEVYGNSGYAVHLILHTYRSRPIFGNSRFLARLAVKYLEEAARAQRTELFAYCLMPTHLHVLAAAREEGASVLKFEQVFKTKMTWATKGMLTSKLWQRSVYDHVARQGKALQEMCEYIVNNPVEAGLVERWDEWPYSWMSEEV